MASDESLLEGNGSTGWIFAMKMGYLSFEKNQRGAAPVDCNPEENASTLCEVSGILACLSMIKSITTGLARGTIMVGCDSLDVLAGVHK